MAQKIYNNKTVGINTKQSPVSSRSYRGVSTVGRPKKFKIYDLDLIKQDILNHFHIRQGEKLENPTFGTIIWDILFEPLTDDLKLAVEKNVTEIINYDPRVSVDKVAIDSYEHGIQIEVQLTYLPYSISEKLQLRFDQNAGLI